MGKKKKFKKRILKNVKSLTPTPSDAAIQKKEDATDYQTRVGNMININEEFTNTDCSESESNVTLCSEPIFFMTNSICNVPSPVTIPAKLYTDTVNRSMSIAKDVGVKMHYNSRYRIEICLIERMIDEMIYSVTNLIISCMSECIDHITHSYAFSEIRALDLITTKSSVLSYNKIFDSVTLAFSEIKSGVIRGILNNKNLRESAMLLDVEFHANTTTLATEVFAGAANEFANLFANSVELAKGNNPALMRMKELNPLMGSGRNETFAIVSAMLTNYTWSFSGIVEAEIHRIACRTIDNYGILYNGINEIYEDDDDWE